jgi:uncharacterized protein
MRNDILPITIDAVRCTDYSSVLTGIYLLNTMERLLPSLISSEGEVKVNVACGVDAQRYRHITAHINTFLTLQCQRCMEPFFFRIDSVYTGCMVKTEAHIDKLPSQFEPIMVDEENRFSLLTLVEDDIILNLPIVAMHEPDECKRTLPVVISGSDVVDNPFKIIGSLKSGSNNKSN